jgi:uncharacterized protein (TIGR02466 family)
MKMSNNCELFSIFPVPVVKFKVPENMMLYVPSLKNRLLENPEKMSSHIITQNKYILDNLEYQELRAWLLARVQEFTNTVLTIDQTAIMTQSWVNRNSPGEYTHTHPHPNSVVSGVFYLDVPDGNAQITFHKPEFGGHGFNILEPKYFTDKDHDYVYVTRVHKMRVDTGELVLFPSWLIHSVPKNETSIDRWSLAFNNMVDVSLGESRRLTEFIYPKT